jgi:predicted nucleotidyltransferase
MTIEEIRQMVFYDPQYEFLQSNPHLKDRIIFLTLGGSYAYGTNVESSDVDVRGCALNSPGDLIGLSSFEQVVNNETDTTIYAFNKLVSLLLNCNPNTIEMLGCKPEHYFFISDIGKEMIDNRKIFLSQRAVSSFGGYANQQLRRLENAIARDALPQARREEHIVQSMENSMAAFERKYTAFPEGSIRLYTDDSERDDLDREVFADIVLKHYPARQFHSMINDMTNIIGCYEKLNGRNRKKDEEHLNKHAMHLVRLYLMCLDILEKEDICTYRCDDREYLLDIRLGKFQNPDGTYRDEFFQMINEFEKRLQYAKENTSLPKTPDYHVVEEFVMSVNRRAIAI